MASAPGEALPIDSQPPPDILPSDPPLPPVVDPPVVSPPAPDAVPPTVTPPPAPDAVPPTVTPPPAPDAVPPTVTPPPAPDAVPPTVTPPPAPDAVPPTVTPPPVPDAVPPTVTPPPVPDVPPPVTPPPAPDVVPPPVTPPPAPDVVPPVVSPPAPDAVPPPVISPPAPDAVPPPVISPPPPDVVPPPVTPPPAPDVVPPVISPPAPDVVPPPMSPPLVPDVVPPPSSDSPPSPNVLSPPPPVNSSPGIPSPSTSHSPPSINPKSPPSSKSTTTPVIVGAALGSVALLLAVFGLFWFVCVRKKKNRRRNPHEIESYYKPADGHNGNSAQSGYPSSGQQFSSSNVAPSPLAPSQSMSSSAGFSSGQPQQSSANSNSYGATEGSFLSSGTGMVLGSGTIAFTYDELKIATNGFSSVNLLGQGGFGYVHKGMLQNGKIVAVKSLKADSGQGEREFQAEVETISRVHHKHLVTLVGYCVTDKEKLLVYEFVQNKTMEFHLHGKGQPVMDWQTRLKIAVGSAKGLAYLHEDCHPKIIHRDIKAANILLDHSFEAQVADFGLAKFTSDANTHVSTRVMGTFGYLAPEYASSGQLSDKSDVFSFGVLLLELITGRRPVDFTSGAQMDDSLVDWARPILAKALQDGSIDSLVDPRLEKNYNPAEMGAMITCAASCVRHSAKRRPRLSEVVRALEGNMKLSDLNDGVEPGFSSLYSSTDLYAAPNTEDMSRFRRMAHGPDDEESSDFSATRNEFTGGR